MKQRHWEWIALTVFAAFAAYVAVEPLLAASGVPSPYLGAANRSLDFVPLAALAF